MSSLYSPLYPTVSHCIVTVSPLYLASLHPHYILTVSSLYLHCILTVSLLCPHYIPHCISLYLHCILTVSPLYPHCIPTVLSPCTHSKPSTCRRKNVRTIISNNLNIVKMLYKYERVCPICQRPRVVNLSSHLEMVHD